LLSKVSKIDPGNEGHYTLRVATVSDADTLTRVGKETFSDTFAAMNTVENIEKYLNNTFTVDQLRKELNDPRCTFILLYEGKQVAGYAKLRKGDNDLNEVRKLVIERIYAGKQYIGKKAGKALMQTCLDIARRENYDAVWLGVWEHNVRAIAFYHSWGFKTVGAHPFWLGDDIQTDLVMEKKLNEDENSSL
jgi:ribosomal protein S18 acetylase RimI-like enzyme